MKISATRRKPTLVIDGEGERPYERPFAETSFEWLRTDDLSRHPESQIRASLDPNLVAEYAEAMLEGAEFPPVVVYQDANGWKYLADGHHRVDAAALAALQDTNREATVSAEIRPGTFADAVRYAMGANVRHGKRMLEADYRRAIKMAFDHNLITAAHAKDVVPEIVALVGCSIRVAQENSVTQRKELVEKRDRHILAMHREGRSQEAIGVELGVSQKTVSNVIDCFSKKRGAAQTTKTNRLPPPEFDWEEPASDEAPAAAPADTGVAAYKIDVKPYLPFLKPLRPIDEGGDDLESGAVGHLPEVVEAIEDDPAAIAALERIHDAVERMLKKVNASAPDLAKPFDLSSARKTLTIVDRAADFLDELREYLKGESSP